MSTQIRGLQIKDAFFGAGLIRNSGDNNVMDVNVDDSSIEISTDALQIKALGVTNDMLAGSIADDKLTEDYIKTSEVDDSSIEFNGGTLNVKASGVTNDMLAGSIADGKLASDYVQTSEVDDSSIEWSGSALQVKASGITNAMLAGSIADDKLSEDYVKTSEVDDVTIEATALSGGGVSLNVKAGGIDTTELADEAVTEAKLDAHDAPADGEILSWNDSEGKFEWIANPAVSGITESDIAFEDESANCDGVEDEFTLSNTPIANSVQVFLNGLLQQVGVGKDYTIAGTTVTFDTAPETGDILLIHYTIDN